RGCRARRQACVADHETDRLRACILDAASPVQAIARWGGGETDLQKERILLMQVEERPITSIRPYENNPRLNDEAVDAVSASIREFGFRQPIVIDEGGVIIVGHARY